MQDDGLCPVIGRINVGRYSEAAFSTRLSASPEAWLLGRATGKSSASREINRRLDGIRATALSVYQELSAIRVVSTDGFSATYPMTAEELRCHARLQGEDANGYLRQLAILCITHEDATELTNRVKELTARSTGSITLPLRQSDYNPEQAKTFISHQCTVLTRLMPRDTSSSHSANREWEVGKQPRYDHIDNQQSGTQLTM